MAVRYPMTVIECKRNMLKLSNGAKDTSKYKLFRKGTSPANRFVEVADIAYNGSFEERKLYLFGLQQLVDMGYVELVGTTVVDSIPVEEYELTYGGILAVLDPRWDLSTAVNTPQSMN